MEFISSYALRYGRIPRATWLFRLIALSVACVAFGMLAKSIAGDPGAALLAALFVWCVGSISIQRLHDIGKSGWSLLALLIPVLGPLWLLLQFARRGVEGRNRYGRDPLARMDYLKVDITR